MEASRRLAERAGIEHVVCDIDLRTFGGSALTADIDVPKHDHVDQLDDEVADGAIPVTYVPARNTIFLSFALALAEVRGADDIFIGVNALDYSGYPDCRPEFIAAFATMANLATRAGVEGATRSRSTRPLIELTKAEIIARGIALGVDYAPDHQLLRPHARRAGLRPLRLVPAAGEGLPRRRRGRSHPLRPAGRPGVVSVRGRHP